MASGCDQGQRAGDNWNNHCLKKGNQPQSKLDGAYRAIETSLPLYQSTVYFLAIASKSMTELEARQVKIPVLGVHSSEAIREISAVFFPPPKSYISSTTRNKNIFFSTSELSREQIICVCVCLILVNITQ